MRKLYEGRNERLPEMMRVRFCIVQVVKTVPWDTAPHAGCCPIISNGVRCTGGRNHLSSARARSYLFRASFRAMPVVGPSIVGLANGPEHL